MLGTTQCLPPSWFSFAMGKELLSFPYYISYLLINSFLARSVGKEFSFEPGRIILRAAREAKLFLAGREELIFLPRREGRIFFPSEKTSSSPAGRMNILYDILPSYGRHLQDSRCRGFSSARRTPWLLLSPVLHFIFWFLVFNSGCGSPNLTQGLGYLVEITGSLSLGRAGSLFC